MAPSPRPAWLSLVVALERAVGSRLEEATRSDEFAELLTNAAKLESGLRAAYLRATAGTLHRANLPAWSDVLRLAEQVTALERRVADLAVDLERTPARSGTVTPRSNRRRPRSSAP